jgi:hypothetical protein
MRRCEEENIEVAEVIGNHCTAGDDASISTPLYPQRADDTAAETMSSL